MHAYDMVWEDVRRTELVVVQAKEEEVGKKTAGEKVPSRKRRTVNCRASLRAGPVFRKIAVWQVEIKNHAHHCTTAREAGLHGGRSEEKKTGVDRSGLADRSGRAACFGGDGIVRSIQVDAPGRLLCSCGGPVPANG